MARFLKDRIKTKGQAPGTLVFIGNQKMETPLIQLMQYDSEYLIENEQALIEEAFSSLKPSGVNWINVYRLHDLELIRNIGKLFEIPSLVMEEIVNTDQRPKYEDEENHDVLILKMLRQSDDARIHAEQVSIILSENYIITLQERQGDVFSPVRERIRRNKGRLHLNNNDYLAYALMDTIFASIFIPLTFIAGVYGMKFRYLPEPEFKYSYPIFWGVVLLTVGVLLVYSKRKNGFRIIKQF